ncbi:MAG: hypothetical protein WCX61_00290 [Candidatus Peribacteraceae bacterium]
MTYLLWPNPGMVPYDNSKVVALFCCCGAMVVAAFILRVWRRRTTNTQLRKLSRSWSGALIWFGVIGLVLLISRTEQISYLSMRIWWVVWAVILVVYIAFQLRQFQTRYYKKLPGEHYADPRQEYLPRKKKRR